MVTRTPRRSLVKSKLFTVPRVISLYLSWDCPACSPSASWNETTMLGPSLDRVSQASHRPIRMATSGIGPDHRQAAAFADRRLAEGLGLAAAHVAEAVNGSACLPILCRAALGSGARCTASAASALCGFGTPGGYRCGKMPSGRRRRPSAEAAGIFADDSRAVRSGASGAIDAVGAMHGMRRRGRLVNNGGAVRSGAAGAVDAVGAGDGLGRAGHGAGQRRRRSTETPRRAEQSVSLRATLFGSVFRFCRRPAQPSVMAPPRTRRHERHHGRVVRTRPPGRQKLRAPPVIASISPRRRRQGSASGRCAWP